MPRQRIPLAWKNLVHQPRRLIVAVCGIGFAVVLMFMQLGFRNALFDSTVALHRLLDADLVLTSTARYTLSVKETFSRRRLAQALGCPKIAAAWPLYIETGQSIWKNPETGQGHPIRVLAFDPRDPVLPIDAAAAAELQMPGTLLLDRRSKEDYGTPQIGDKIELADHVTRIVGTFDLGTDFANDGNVIMSSDQYRSYFSIPGSRHDKLAEVDVGLLKVKPGVAVTDALHELQATLPEDVSVMTGQQFVDQELTFWRRSTPIGFIFGLGTVMGFIVGVVICYQILYSDVDDHMAEFATLKAMGYQNNYFVALVLQESLWLSLFGFAPGVLVATLLYTSLGHLTGLLLNLTASRVIGVLLMTIAMCIVSGCLALRRVFQADPAELF
ncbi:MAG TPA: ABC transporter permease DevC [Pirellulales bacterium]|jgi:putative ABC transport system permease protein